MCLYVNIFGRNIPSYGLLIVLGVVLANLVGMIYVKRNHHDINDFIILEAYTFLGAFTGAKVLYFVIAFQNIEWNRILELDYFNQLMQGGFVFYGGLLGGVVFAFLAGKFHKINASVYVRKYIFLVPLIHCFGRIGCHLAGCCYGIPYSGIGAIEFPEKSLAPSGILLFPVQIAEATILLAISVTIWWCGYIKKWKCTVEIYFILYGIVRFILEFFRYDELRGHVGYLSTSQLIGVLMIGIATYKLFYNKSIIFV